MGRGMWIVIGALAFGVLVPGLALGDETEESGSADAETGGSIVVEISNLQNDEGKIGCSLFSNEDGFPTKSEKADKRVWVQSKSKTASCTFTDVKPGAYSIAVVHDADKNGELNTSFVGRPKEWWGVSNNAPAHRFGPPTFDEAKFQYKGGKQTLKVKLQL